AERTEHTAVPGLWTQQSAARLAVVEVDARIRGHRFNRYVSAFGTRQPRRQGRRGSGAVVRAIDVTHVSTSPWAAAPAAAALPLRRPRGRDAETPCCHRARAAAASGSGVAVAAYPSTWLRDRRSTRRPTRTPARSRASDPRPG